MIICFGQLLFAVVEPRIQLEQIAFQSKRFSSNIADINLRKEKTFDFLNAKRIKTDNPKYEFLFGYEGYTRRVYPVLQLRNKMIKVNSPLGKNIAELYEKLARANKKKGKIKYYYSVKDGDEIVYLLCALSDLSYFIKDFPENGGFCALCKRFSDKNSFNRALGLKGWRTIENVWFYSFINYIKNILRRFF